MRYQSQMIAAGSGSVGGCTYSRNRSGQYIRRRAMPVNPGSAFSQIMTGALASLVTAWTSTLAQSERDLWDTWAFNTQQTKFGQTYFMTGQNAFIAMNSPRVQAGLAILTVAPAVYSGASLSPPVVTIADESAQTFTFTFNNADAWANSASGSLFIFASRPQNASRQFFKGPYRFVERLAGATPTPPTSPHVTTGINTPFPFALGQKMFLQFRAQDADGRISTPYRDGIVAVA